MSRRSPRRPRLLLLSMYPLDRGAWGATVRIAHMRDELAEMAELDVIDGYRGARSLALLRYALSGRLRGLAGIYVESSSFLPSPVDIAFLGLARALGIGVLTYIRDAQSLFAEYYPGGSLKRWISRSLFRPAFGVLMSVSGRVAFPSTGLAAALGRGETPLLIPPGAPPPVHVERLPDAKQLLFVGGMRYPVHGLDILVEAIETVRADGLPVELTCVSRPGEEPPEPHPAWLHVARGSGGDIHRLLPDVIASVTPRRRSPYNDLGVPIKVMEYLSYGRPLLVTDCTETARIVEDSGAGYVVPDTAEGLADGIRRLFASSGEELDALSAATAVAAERNSWHARARQVLDLLTNPQD
ncbi:MAG TPA: glycosyltransferase [Candidatus Limnocylindria bacterium]|nr:glycosyltransferase [Candidatus Limnocylindria bacterium]